MPIRLVIALAGLASAPLFADSGSGQTVTPPPKEKKVCRREERTRSIMQVTTCKTKSEWAEIDKANAQNVDLFKEDRALQKVSEAPR